MSSVSRKDAGTETTYCSQTTRDPRRHGIVLYAFATVFTIAAKPPAFNYPVTPYFSDVLAVDPDFPWVQRLKQDGITSGCTITTYRPDLQVSRGDGSLPHAGSSQSTSDRAHAPGYADHSLNPHGGLDGNVYHYRNQYELRSGYDHVGTDTGCDDRAGHGEQCGHTHCATDSGCRCAHTGRPDRRDHPLGEQLRCPMVFRVVPSGLTITSISPASAAPGALVTAVGTNFVPAASVILSQQGGGTVPAAVVSVNPGSLSFVVPANAVTGPVSVSGNGQTAAL